MKRFVVAMLTLPVFLVGCGSDTGSTTSTTSDQSGYLDGTYTYGKVALPDGRVLECVTMERSYGQNKWGGIDCQWPETNTTP